MENYLWLKKKYGFINVLFILNWMCIIGVLLKKITRVDLVKLIVFLLFLNYFFTYV